MAITIVATVGGASSNSFVLLTEFETYLDSRLNATTEDALSDDLKNRALAEATRYLSVLNWCGYRVDGTQLLSWPRQWALDPDSPVQDYYATTVIPQRVKDGTMELALQFLQAGTTDVAALDPTRNVKRKKVDVLETEYFEPDQSAQGLARYPSVLRHIGLLLEGVGIRRTVST